MAHKELQKVVNLLSLDLNVYLFGPAGTGKTVLCSQAAAALGLEFYSDQRVGDTFTLSGFVDASGKYQETAFYQAFSRGGLYMLDEFDASDPNAVIWLNTALANGFATFPALAASMHTRISDVLRRVIRLAAVLIQTIAGGVSSMPQL